MTAESPEQVVLPAGLRERVMTASHQTRPPGRTVPEVVEDSPIEAFAHAAEAFSEMLGSLTAADWHLPVLRDLDVQGLVGHLTGVERDVHSGMAGDRAGGQRGPRAVDPAHRAPAGGTGRRRRRRPTGAWRSTIRSPWQPSLTSTPWSRSTASHCGCVTCS